jgi:excinuclease UvrABC nuclease subunit
MKKKDKEMKEAAKNLEFELAAILRDEVMQLEKEIRKRSKTSPLPSREQKKVDGKRVLRHGRTR